MMTSVRGDKLSYPAFWRAKGSPITFLQSMFTVQTHWVKQCCYDTSSIWRAKVHWQEVRSSCGPHGAKDRHALWGRKGVVSGTAGQKYSVLLRLGSMLTTPNSLITAVASKLVAVGFFFCCCCSFSPQANGLVMVWDNNTLVVVGLGFFFWRDWNVLTSQNGVMAVNWDFRSWLMQHAIQMEMTNCG